MNKKLLVTGLVAVMVATFIVVTSAFAQGPQPPVTPGSGLAYGRGAGGYGMGFRFGASGHSLVDITAQVTGLSEEDVIAGLQSGKTFAQVAEAHGKTAQDLVNTFVADRKAILDQAVAEGRITQDVADTMLATMKANVEQHVNAAWQPRGGGYGGPCPMGNAPGTGTQFRGGMHGGRRNQ
jgi:hypothetical protein